MTRIIVALIFFSATTCSFAQSSVRDRVVLPATKTTATVTLLLPEPLSDGSSPVALAVTDDKGKFLSPQPAIKIDTTGATAASPVIRLEFSNLFFWGEARLPLKVSPAVTYPVVLQRGPAVNGTSHTVGTDNRAAVWLYNFASEPLKVKYRVLSAGEGACGIDTAGAPQNCGALDKWYDGTIQPAHSDPLRFIAPPRWFRPWAANAEREASLEMRFGDESTPPEQRLTLRLQSSPDKFSLQRYRQWAAALVSSWLPGWISELFGLLGGTLWTFLWITVGAICLMVAQIMIPNFRRVLQIEDEVERFEERLRAVNSGVGERLLTRSKRELMVLRSGLLMPQPDRNVMPFSGQEIANKLKLSGSTSNVNLLGALANRIESRLRLMERLDESQTESSETSRAFTPPSLFWKRKMDVRKVQSILSHQLINDADEKAARAILDTMDDEGQSRTAFVAELLTRITAIRRRFPLAGDPPILDLTLTQYLVPRFPRSAALMRQKEFTAPTVALTDHELADLDIDVYRVEVVADIIGLKSVLDRPENKGVEAQILSVLESTDVMVLAEARLLLTMASQGIDENAIRKAIEDGMWDIYSEPVLILEQDVLRVWLFFRDQRLNTAAARSRIECTWEIEVSPAATDPIYETGWDLQILVGRDQELKLSPQFWLRSGEEVKRQRDPDSTDGELKPKVLEVTPRKSIEEPARARALRGAVDAMITALVPVATVAITQFQNSGGTPLTIEKLILLGFTSQAIRAAFTPESVATATPSAAGTTGNQPTSGRTTP